MQEAGGQERWSRHESERAGDRVEHERERERERVGGMRDSSMRAGEREQERESR